MTGSVKILDWRPLKKNSLLGFAKAEFPSGMVICDVTILTGERGPWASPPGKPMLDREGAALKDATGKLRYSPIIEFTSKSIRIRWSDAVISAMREAHPEVFA
jgi:hypothetical protein